VILLVFQVSFFISFAIMGTGKLSRLLFILVSLVLSFMVTFKIFPAVFRN
jgi:hypothetical protein